MKPVGEQAKISGSVMNDGKPLPANCEVVFFNKDKNATLGAKLDATGKFSLAVADPKIGIPVGRYQVAIRPPATPTVQPSSADYAKMMQSGGAKPEDKSASVISEKFHAFETSKLEFDVKAGPNEFNMDLSKL